ncbi:hypothetical protein [Candidatus Poriferisocius sp.]
MTLTLVCVRVWLTADFPRELATACRGLTGADYGDNPAHLETDACA